MAKQDMAIAQTDVLEKLIQQSGLTKSAFCEQFGYSDSWIGGVLRDGRIKPQTARMIAKAYGVPYETLVIVPDSPVTKGAGLTGLEVAATLQKVEEALKLVHEVREVLKNARQGL